ncbi:MAG: glycosyltransferase family 39 protein [Phycisphaerales bacterium]
MPDGTTPHELRAWWASIARSPWAVPAFVLALTLARLVWMVWFSHYTLIEDEAHYWEWSRRLGWSYYSKGPGVAWVIGASTAVFGDVEWAVRLPAVLASAVGSFAAAAMARDCFDTDRPGARAATPFVAALLYQCVPAFAITSVLMTIDGPYVACWTLAAWLAARALLRDRPRAWVGFGVALAAAFLFKYTALLLVPGVALALLSKPIRARARAQLGWIALGLAIACLGFAPVVVWNATHGWATVHHLLGHLGVRGGDVAPAASDPWTPWSSPEYLALTVITCGPVLILGLLAWIERKRAGTGARFAIACALPILAFYFVVSLDARVEGNWAIAACASLVAPAAWLIVDGVARRDLAVRVLWGLAIVCGVGVNLALPALPAISRVGRLGARIPVHRMTGMRDHAADAQRWLDALRDQTGREPFVVSEHYGRASQLAFYLPGHPTVYCASALVGGRKTQYDLWPETDLTNPQTLATLRGRPALPWAGRAGSGRPGSTRCSRSARSPPSPRRTGRGVGYDFTTLAGWNPAAASGGRAATRRTRARPRAAVARERTPGSTP